MNNINYFRVIQPIKIANRYNPLTIPIGTIIKQTAIGDDQYTIEFINFNVSINNKPFKLLTRYYFAPKCTESLTKSELELINLLYE